MIWIRCVTYTVHGIYYFLHAILMDLEGLGIGITKCYCYIIIL